MFLFYFFHLFTQEEALVTSLMDKHQNRRAGKKLASKLDRKPGDSNDEESDNGEEDEDEGSDDDDFLTQLRDANGLLLPLMKSILSNADR